MSLTNDVKFNSGGNYYETQKPSGGNLMFAGMIMPYAGATAPPNWLVCDGRSLSSSLYPDLFSAIGYTFGGSAGNFNIPLLSGKIARGGVATGFNLGAVGGNDSIVLSASQMPAHTHAINDPGHIHTAPSQNQDGTGGLIDNTPSLFNFTPGNPTAVATTGITLGNTGGTPDPISLVQPYIALNYIIRTVNGGLINLETASPIVAPVVGPVETVYLFALYTTVAPSTTPDWYWCDINMNMESPPVLIVDYTGGTGKRDNITYTISGHFYSP